METNLNTVTVILDEREAQQFILFQKYYEMFVLLNERNVLDQKGAAITLHFDKLGTLRNITRVDTLYDHRYDFINTN